MVWPPSVRGVLVTEGVRGEGGVLRNSDGKRFMFDDIPANYKPQTADNEEEGWRYVTGDKSARRPPELLTRDHVARCIVKQIKSGKGSPHGGVFLNIAWIKEKLPDGEAHIKRKLPSMYHQFKELAGIDITQEAMEVGPTTHYAMGGIRVEAESQMTCVPGLYAAGECASGLHGANRLGGNSLSDLLVFGKRAGEYAAEFAKQSGAISLDDGQIEAASKWATAPFERKGENPFAVQKDLQDMMQDQVGIVRIQAELDDAVQKIAALRQRAANTSVDHNRDYNPGWHTVMDLEHMLTVAEAIARAAAKRTESRGAHFREDHPEKSESLGQVNAVLKKGDDGQMQIEHVPVTPIRKDLQEIIEEQKS